MGILKFLCALSLPPPVFFGNRSEKSSSWWARATFCLLLHPPAPFFFEIDVAYPGVCLHPQLSVCLFTPPAPPPSIFYKSKWKSSSCWAPSAFCALFHPPRTHFFGKSKCENAAGVLRPQLAVCFFSPAGLFRQPLPITLAFVPPSFSFSNSL